MKLTLLIALVLASLKIYAQNGSRQITGTITDVQNKPLAGAAVQLYNAKDTLYRQTRTADAKGAFIFNRLPDGTYSLAIFYTGFKAWRDSLVTVDGSHPAVNLPLIVLQPVRHALKEVVISSKKPLIEQQIDRTIVNVDAMISAAGGNALEVLSKSPGVIVDANGGISLNGKNNVLVLIDEKPTYMSAQDLAAYLRSLPGGMLAQLELISNPPARYDANGNAIINIVLKKNKSAGFNGALTVGYNQGADTRSNDALNVSYRTSRFNIFSSLSYSLDENFSNRTFSRYFYNPDGSLNTSIMQNSKYTYRSNNYNARIGMDYFLTTKTTLGIVLTGNTRPKTDLLNYNGHQFDGNGQLDSVSRGYTSGKYHWKNTGINLNLQHRFDSTGTVLTVNLDQLTYISAGNQLSPAEVYLPDGALASEQLRVFTFPSAVHIYAGKADYTHSLPGKAEFDAGIKSSYVSTDNQSGWFNMEGDNLVPDYSQTNHFRYTENINSAYINLKKVWKRWAVQGGLRLENTNSNGHQYSNLLISDTSFARTYTNLFPSLYLSHKLDSTGNNNVVLSYSKRIRRPSYQQLNPFLFFQDRYSYNSGNPDLVPTFAHYVELKYNYKQFFGINISYGGGNNGINPLTRAENDVFITRPDNYINTRTFGVAPYFSLAPGPWWDMNVNLVLLSQVIKGSAGGITVYQKTDVHEIEIFNQFRMGKTWNAELTGFFPGSQTYGQSRNSSIYNLSAGLQKIVLDGQGTVRLNANDIFHGLRMRSQTLGISQVAAFSTNETDSRWVGLSFTYRFGKAANARKRNDSSSAEEEKGRTD